VLQIEGLSVDNLTGIDHQSYELPEIHTISVGTYTL
jgi:hypothetical protein